MGFCRGYIGIMENKMEARGYIGLSRGYIGIVCFKDNFNSQSAHGSRTPPQTKR